LHILSIRAAARFLLALTEIGTHRSRLVMLEEVVLDLVVSASESGVSCEPRYTGGCGGDDGFPYSIWQLQALYHITDFGRCQCA